MDRRVRERLEAKISEASERRAELVEVADAVGRGSVTPYAMLAGLLYNSFYYQTRRVCGRDPTRAEVREFVDMLGARGPDLERALDR